MKTKDGRAGFACKHRGSGFRNIPRSAWPVDGKGGVASLANQLRQFHERAHPAARTGTACGSVAKSLNTLGNGFTVKVHAGHDDNTPIAPVVSRSEEAAVPESKDGAVSAFQDFIEVGIADRLPAHRPADDRDNEITNPADQPCFEPLAASET